MHIKSIDELVGFLSILQESDPKEKKYKEQLNSDKEHYNLKKVKKEKETTDEVDEVEAEEEIETDQKAQAKSKKITPTLDNLIRNINDLRSGESLKRAEIRSEVAEYFDSLSEDEQKVLVLFLRELAAVVTKSKDGSDAQDPSDEPEKLVIKSTESEKAEEPPTPEKPQSSGAPETEDDSAPIKVNESQDLTEVKKIFNRLSGDKNG